MATIESKHVCFVASATQKYIANGVDPLDKTKMSISPNRNIAVMRTCGLWESCQAFQKKEAELSQVPDGCPGVAYIEVEIIGRDKFNNGNFKTPASRYRTVFCNSGYVEDDTIQLW